MVCCASCVARFNPVERFRGGNWRNGITIAAPTTRSCARCYLVLGSVNLFFGATILSLKVGNINIRSRNFFQSILILTVPDKIIVVLRKGVARYGRSMMLLVLVRARTKRFTDRTDHRSPRTHDDLQYTVV